MNKFTPLKKVKINSILKLYDGIPFLEKVKLVSHSLFLVKQ